MKLYVYEGGGYDGCFWEYNWFWSHGNIVYPGFTTGRAGWHLAKVEQPTKIKRTDLAEFVKDEPTLKIYDKPDGLRLDSYHPNLIHNIARTAPVGVSLGMKCTDCGEWHIATDLECIDGYSRGNGGTGTIHEEFWCEECMDKSQCSLCRDYEKDIVKNRCSDCTSKIESELEENEEYMQRRKEYMEAHRTTVRYLDVMKHNPRAVAAARKHLGVICVEMAFAQDEATEKIIEELDFER